MKLTAKPNRARLAPSDVEILGVVGTFTYGRYDGTEYLIGSMSAEDSVRPPADDEIRIVSPRTRTDYGTVTAFQEWQRGTPVPPGTYERMAAKAAGRFRGPKPPRPIDLVSRLPALRGTPDRVLPARERSASRGAPTFEGESALFGVSSLPPGGAFVAGTPATAGPAAIIQKLARMGVVLSLTPGGRLLAVTAGGRLDEDVLVVLLRTERLIIGALTGHPVKCEAPHDGPAPDAWTVAAVDVPLCRGHADGSLPKGAA